MADATYADLLGSDLLLHYDASVPANLFTDVAGTLPASDGNEIKCWAASADAAITNKASHTAGPIYRENYAATGYPGLEFDGVDDALRVTGTTLSATSRYFLLVAFHPVSTVFGTLISRGSSGTIYHRIYKSTIYAMQGGSTLTVPSTLTAGGLTDVVLSSVWGVNQTVLDSRLQAAGTSGGAGYTLADVLTIGAGDFGGGPTQPANCVIREVILVGSGCEWGQVQRAAKIMRNKWGVSDPNPLPQASSGGGNPMAAFQTGLAIGRAI